MSWIERWPKVLLAASVCLTASALALAQSSGKRANGQKAATSATPDATEAAQGKVVYREQCEICHFSKSTAKKIGPGLKGLYKRGRFADAKKVDDASLEAWIEKGGKDMPAFKETLKPEQIRALIAYLKTL